MKKIIGLLTVLLISFSAVAQSSEKIKFKTVIKDRKGEVVTNTPVELIISVIQGSAVGRTLFSEVHNVTTAGDGSINVIVGEGELIGGDISKINWQDNISFIKTEVPALGVLKMSKVKRIPNKHAEVAKQKVHAEAFNHRGTTVSKAVSKPVTEVKDTLVEKVVAQVATPQKEKVDVSEPVIALNDIAKEEVEVPEVKELLPEVTKLEVPKAKIEPVVKEKPEGSSFFQVKFEEAGVNDTAAKAASEVSEEIQKEKRTRKSKIETPAPVVVKTEKYQKASFSTVVKNINGVLFTNAPVVLKTSVLEGTVTGEIIYAETHMTKTDANGIATVDMGTGARYSGDYENVDWNQNVYFIRTEAQPTGVTKLDKVNATTMTITQEERELTPAGTAVVAVVEVPKIQSQPEPVSIPEVIKPDTVETIVKKEVSTTNVVAEVKSVEDKVDSVEVNLVDTNKVEVKTPNVSPVETPFQTSCSVGDSAMTAGKYKVAIAEYSTALETDTANSTLYYARGLANKKSKNKVKAIADYTEAIKLDSTYSQAYYKRGNTKADLKDTRGAIVDYQKAISLDPANKKTHYNLGVMQVRLKNYSESITYFEKATSLDPSWGLAYYHKGVSKIKIGELNDGCLDLSKAGELGFDPAYEAIKLKCAN